MPRNSSGTFSLPVAAFVPGGLIKSSDLNSNFSDIATALTQSLATTGVSTMTGPIKGALGSVSAPSYTFNGALTTGFYLAGSNQIGWASNGVQGATFNSDTSVTWAGGATFGGTISANKGTIPLGSVVDFAGSSAPAGWLLCFGQLVSTTTYAGLFAVLSTTYGSGAGTFGIPDYRGRTGRGQDNMGGSAANRITNAISGIVGTTLGAAGGDQNYQQHNHTINDPTHTHGFAHTLVAGSNGTVALTPGSGNTAGTFGQDITVTNSTATGITINNNGSGAAGNVAPTIITNKIIYAGA